MPGPQRRSSRGRCYWRSWDAETRREPRRWQAHSRPWPTPVCCTELPWCLRSSGIRKPCPSCGQRLMPAIRGPRCSGMTNGNHSGRMSSFVAQPRSGAQFPAPSRDGFLARPFDGMFYALRQVRASCFAVPLLSARSRPARGVPSSECARSRGGRRRLATATEKPPFAPRAEPQPPWQPQLEEALEGR